MKVQPQRQTSEAAGSLVGLISKIFNTKFSFVVSLLDPQQAYLIPKPLSDFSKRLYS